MESCDSVRRKDVAWRDYMEKKKSYNVEGDIVGQ